MALLCGKIAMDGSGAVAPKALRLAELEREKAGLKLAVSMLMARVQVLESLVPELQARLAANASNSSRAPASDGLGAAGSIICPSG